MLTLISRFLSGLLSLSLLVACAAPSAAELSPPSPVVPSPSPVIPAPSPQLPATPTATIAPTVLPAPTVVASPSPEPVAEAVPAPTLYRGAPTGRNADGAFTLGDPAAPLTLTEYADFLCVVCRRHALTIEPELVERYVATGRVLYISRPVLNYGEHSLITSAAAVCAGEQDGFWVMREVLFARQPAVAASRVADLPALMAGYAAEIGLDAAALTACLERGAAQQLVAAFDAEQRQRGISSQPIFELADIRLVGLQSIERFASLIETQP